METKEEFEAKREELWSKVESVNFREYPYKGVLDAVARQEGIKRHNVWQKVRRKELRILALVLAEIEKRIADEIESTSILKAA